MISPGTLNNRSVYEPTTTETPLLLNIEKTNDYIDNKASPISFQKHLPHTFSGKEEY